MALVGSLLEAPLHPFPNTPPSSAPSKWCNQRQLFKLGERSPPSLYSAGWGCGGLSGGTPEPWVAGSLLGSPVPVSAPMAILGPEQGLPACSGLSLFSSLDWPCCCPGPGLTPPPIIIRGNFRAGKGAISSLWLTPTCCPAGPGARMSHIAMGMGGLDCLSFFLPPLLNACLGFGYREPCRWV